MAKGRKKNGNEGKRVTRYTFDDVRDPQVSKARFSETAHSNSYLFQKIPMPMLFRSTPMEISWVGTGSHSCNTFRIDVK